MRKVSLTRLYLLHACYLLMFVGLSIQLMPDLLFGAIVTMPLMDGAVIAMLSALGILSALGLFAPLRMLPLLLFEIVWKFIWAVSVGLPRWIARTIDADVMDMMFAVAFVIPWRRAYTGFWVSLAPPATLKEALMMFLRLFVITFTLYGLTFVATASATTLDVAADAPLWMRLGADMLLYLHIGGGAMGMIAGTVAILSRKGQTVHRTAGKVFFVSMLACYAIGAAVAPFLADGQRPNFIAGVLALYLLLTSWRAATRRAPSIGPMDYGGLALAVFVAAAGALFMHQGANHPSGTVDGSPSEAFVLFILVGVLAACGDLHLIFRRSITEVSRISRHLWRMCMSLFIATGSFFFGQEQILPDWLRGTLLQGIPVFFPLAAIVIWLVLVRVGKRGPAAS